MGSTQLKLACCSSCGAQTNACTCGDIPCNMACRFKSATATHCGFLEYTDPSDPAVFYRTQTTSGSNDGCYYDASPGCAVVNPFHGQVLFEYMGSYTFNKDTCEETNTQIERLSNSNPDGTANCGNAIFRSDTAVPKTWTPSNTTNLTRATTPTQDKYTGTGTCGPSALAIITGDSMAELSDEDTDQDAIARAMALIMSWTGCTLCSDATCTAFTTVRSGVEDTFAFRSVQSQISWTAVIGKSYKVTTRFYRRTLGSGGIYLFFSLDERIITADNVSETTDWLDVPNEAGFETIAWACQVQLIP